MTGKLKSLPIGITPELKGQEAIEFSEKIKREENILSYPVSTPKIESAIYQILADLIQMEIDK